MCPFKKNCKQEGEVFLQLPLAVNLTSQFKRGNKLIAETQPALMVCLDNHSGWRRVINQWSQGRRQLTDNGLIMS